MENLTEIIKEDILSLTAGLENTIKTSDDILNQLIETINEVDFEILAFEQIEEVKEQIETLKLLVYDADGSLNKSNLIEREQLKKLEKELNGYRLKKNHYLIICIEQLIKHAEANNWGLCKNNNFIYLYNGEYWNEIDKEQFQYFLGKVALKMGVERFQGKHHIFKEDLFKQFMSDAYLPVPKIKKDSVLINLQNGTFEISPKTRGIRDFDPKDFITHQLPFEFKPDAYAPLFQKYLDEVLPDKSKQKVLAEYCGYIFIKPSVLKLEKMLILYGTGANGKSVFFEIINALLGSQNISNYSLQSLTNDTGYYRAKIANKLVNYASELNGKLEADVFKQMVSGEPIEARLPYGEPMLLTEYAKLIFNCNELPRDVENTNAFFRRFLIMGFDVTIAEDKQDKQLSHKIVQNELSGVFNWILEGLERVWKQKGFSKCEAIDNARSNYEKQSDSVKLFVDEFEYKPSKEHTLIKILYEQYKSFCLDDGFRPVNKTNFMKRLSDYKIVVKRISEGNVAYAVTEKSLL